MVRPFAPDQSLHGPLYCFPSLSHRNLFWLFHHLARLVQEALMVLELPLGPRLLNCNTLAVMKISLTMIVAMSKTDGVANGHYANYRKCLERR